MTSEQLAAVAGRWMAEVWQQGNVAAIDDLHAPDFVDSSPAGRPADREGYKAGVADLYQAFPDFYAWIEDLVVDAPAGKVAIRWSATASHRGEFMGVPPTGRSITCCGIDILRIAGDRIVERWGEWDGVDLLRQLGVFLGQTDQEGTMIARTWHGATPLAKADEYLDYLHRTGIPDLRATEGNQGVYVLRRLDGDQAHFILISLWDSMASIQKFAGQDAEKARYYPEDTDYLLELEPNVTHYEVMVRP